MMEYTILPGDCLESLRTLPRNTIHCAVTSPPYYGLRDYGTAEWQGGDPNCAHRGTQARTVSGGDGKQYTNEGSNRVFSGDCACGARRVDRQIGLEETPEAYVERLCAVFAEVRRVLHPSGVLWLNLGDSCNSNASNQNGTSGDMLRPSSEGAFTAQGRRNKYWDGAKPKDLLGIPWMVAFALRARGWYLRADVIWAKPNPMPESVQDRPTKALEYNFLLSKSALYFYVAEAVKEAAVYARDAGARA